MQKKRLVETDSKEISDNSWNLPKISRLRDETSMKHSKYFTLYRSKKAEIFTFIAQKLSKTA